MLNAAGQGIFILFPSSLFLQGSDLCDQEVPTNFRMQSESEECFYVVDICIKERRWNMCTVTHSHNV